VNLFFASTKLLEGNLTGQQRSYISINFAFTEFLLIMVGLFINLLVSSVQLFNLSIMDYDCDEYYLRQLSFTSMATHVITT